MFRWIILGDSVHNGSPDPGSQIRWAASNFPHLHTMAGVAAPVFFRRYPNSEVTLARNEELNSLWGTTADSVYDLSLSGFANREACKPLHDNILVEVVASHCMISLNSRRKLYFFEFPYVIKHGLNSRAMLADTRG